MAHKHGENCNCGGELSDMIGTALATKLYDDTAKAARDTELEVIRLLGKSLTDRQALLADEMSHVTEENRSEALALLAFEHKEHMLCATLRLAATLANATGDVMSSFVGHAARHFEKEAEQHAMLLIVKDPFGNEEAQSIKDAATASTGADN